MYNLGMRCLDCNYDLRSLCEHRCPECGRPFEPNDAKTFGPRKPMASLRQIILLLVAWVVSFGVVVLATSCGLRPGRGPLLLLLPFQLAVLLVFVIPMTFVIAIVFWVIRRLFPINR